MFCASSRTATLTHKAKNIANGSVYANLYSVQSMREALIQSFAYCTICRCSNSSSMQFLLSRSKCGALRLMNEISIRIVIVGLPTNSWTCSWSWWTPRKKARFVNLIFRKLISRWMLAAMKFHFEQRADFSENHGYPQEYDGMACLVDCSDGLTALRYFLKYLLSVSTQRNGTTCENALFE